MKIRVRDIAAKAGVSPSTVSNALNGRDGVSPEIASQIQRLAEKMGYVGTKANIKNARKKYVRLVMFKRHGLVVMDTQFFAELMESIERECRANDYNLLITHIHMAEDQDYKLQIRSICEDVCAGIILLGTEMYKEDLEMFRDCASPMVVLDNLFRHEKVHSVAVNNYDAGYQATNALIACGHRKIDHITSKIEISNMRYRRKGYEAALIANGLQPQNIWRVTPTLEGAYKDMMGLLEKKHELPTAFFSGNDIMAVGCMRALQERKINVPNDVSMIGMDDLQLAQFASPPLSTIKVYRRGLGVTAVRTLLSLSADMEKGCILKTELGVEMIHRTSVKTLCE